jgi:hypothetical protein
MGREMLKTILEHYDEQLRLERDFKAYRNKGQRKTSIKTVMGTVEYNRSVYQCVNEDGTKSCVFLLDEAIGREGSGLISGNLAELVSHAVCESSYRATARAVSEMTGQTLSHQAAWGVVQQTGTRIDALEKRAAAQAAKNEGIGKLESPVLFEEQDGVWLPLQGKSRKQYGPKREMKLAKATGKLSQTLQSITSLALPEKYTEEFLLKPLAAAKAPKVDGKGYEPLHAGAIPATPDFNFLREIGRVRSIFS